MALEGTIRDFGIADIFQLIGQQAKTGTLILSNDVDEVRVFFHFGSVVRAESRTRPVQMLLGSLLARAGVLTHSQLDVALREQKRTLKRLGLILSELNFATRETIAEFATLQMTETIYTLFSWTDGTYRFEAGEVEPSPEGVEPVRAENIVMNGIRITDEWPSIREKLPSYAWQVERVRPLSALIGTRDAEEIGATEKMIYDLITSGRTVQRLIDLSRLGEFETCRAISTLMGAGAVRVIKPFERRGRARSWWAELTFERVLLAVSRFAISALLVIVAGLFVLPALGSRESDERSAKEKFAPIQNQLGERQRQKLQHLVDVFQLTEGRYPQKIEELVERGWATEDEIRVPFQRPYSLLEEDGVGPLVLLPFY